MEYPIIKTPEKREEREGVSGLAFPQILQASFTTLIVGKPGSGKTYLIEQLLTDKQFYYRLFDQILFITPSQLGDFILTPENSSPKIDTRWIYDQLEQSAAGRQRRQRNVLIILDDVVADMRKLENDKGFLNLFNNRRHIIPNTIISFIITTQKYNLCPLVIRTILTSVVLFGITHHEEASITKELLFDGADLVKSYLGSLKPYEFIYIRLSPYLVCLNFKPLRLQSEQTRFAQLDRFRPVDRVTAAQQSQTHIEQAPKRI